MYSENKEHNYTTKKLINLISKGNIELLGMSYEINDIDFNYLPEPYIKLIQSDNNALEFEGKVFAHDRDKVSIGIADRVLTNAGLGYVKVENMEGGLEKSNLMADLMLQGTNQSGIKKVVVGSTFIDPEVTYQNITMAKDIKLRLFKIKEHSVLTDTSYTVYLLTTEKSYDGQSLLGMLSKKDKLNKRDTRQLLDFIISDGHLNPLINREFPGAFMEMEDLSFNIFNTNKTGIYFLKNETLKRFSIASGQSFISFNTPSILNSKVVNIGNNNYELEVNIKGNKKLTIFF